MLREAGIRRLPEPAGVDLDRALLYHNHEYMANGHAGMIAAVFGPPQCWVPGLEESLTEDKLVIDIACGTGEFTGELAKRFPNPVIGVDISPDAVVVARRNYPNVPNLEFWQGDAYALAEKYPRRAGLLTANMALHNFDDLDRALREVYASLQDDGIFFFSDLDPEKILRDDALQLVYSARTELGDAAFVSRFLAPILCNRSLGDVLDVALMMSTIAAYTEEEISDALRRAGFAKEHVETDESGDALIGYAVR